MVELTGAGNDILTAYPFETLLGRSVDVCTWELFISLFPAQEQQ